MHGVFGTGTESREIAPAGGNRLRDAFAVWLRVSLAGVGGPALQIATMHRLLVKRKAWISNDRFFHALSYCIALPGPETQQLAVYVGWLAHRMIGGVIAGGLFILPGVICMMALCYGYTTGADSDVGQAIFLGVRPAILAIMVEAILRFGRHVLHGRWMVALAGLAFLAAFLKIAFPLVVIGAAILGICAATAGLRGFERPLSDPAEGAPRVSAREDLPDHTLPSMPHLFRSMTIWLVLWLSPAIALLAIFGPENVYTQISLVFGKVALMAIGGDYAVIAASAQQVVDSFHWLSAREMQEGIAMGEMVPGTIMIVTQFLGFIAAYREPGMLSPLLAGALGGLLATWMTFAPCFLWIFCIAPFIEGLRRHTLLNNTLQAVTAAAVGMIVNLSVWFGIHTLFHDVESVRFAFLAFDVPKFSSFDPWAFVLFVLAAIAMLRFKVSAVVTLFGSSALGLLLLLFGLTG